MARRGLREARRRLWRRFYTPIFLATILPQFLSVQNMSRCDTAICMPDVSSRAVEGTSAAGDSTAENLSRCTHLDDAAMAVLTPPLDAEVENYGWTVISKAHFRI